MNTLKNKKGWYIILPLVFFMTSGSWLGGCGTESDLSECPDTSFSQTNLDTLEAENPKFIWRVCNANDEYAMENLLIQNYFTNSTDPLSIGTVSPCACSDYFAGPFEGDAPINLMEYRQGGEDHSFIYLNTWPATKGLTDTTSLKDTPGQYTYHFMFERDSSKSARERTKLEIEREAYH